MERDSLTGVFVFHSLSLATLDTSGIVKTRMKPKPTGKIDISTLTYKGQDFDILINKNQISYIFEVNGNRYGNAVKIEGRKKQDMVNASFNLLLNLIATYEAVLDARK